MRARRSLKGQTFLVTGGAGFIGSHVVDALVREGAKAIVLDLLTYSKGSENLDSAFSSSLVELVVGDLNDSTLLEGLFKTHQFDGVLNLAAETHVDFSIQNPILFAEANLMGTARLLEVVRKYLNCSGAEKKNVFKFIQVSSDEVFGELTDHSSKFNETSKYHPSSPYSATKAGADHLVNAWVRTYGFPGIIVYSTNNYGPRQSLEKFIPKMILSALEKLPLPVYGRGDNIRQWIYVKDFSFGLIRVLESGKSGERVCLGGGSELRNLEVAETVCEILDEICPRQDGRLYKSQILFEKDRPGHDFRYALDSAWANRELGFSPVTKFETGLFETVKWYFDKRRGNRPCV